MLKYLVVLCGLVSAVSAFAGLYETDYEMVVASSTNQTLGPVGGSGDIIKRLIIVPETTSPGAVTIRDGNGNAAVYRQTVFFGGTVSDLSPFLIELDARSVSADWNISTGSNVHVIAVGKFK